MGMVVGGVSTIPEWMVVAIVVTVLMVLQMHS